MTRMTKRFRQTSTVPIPTDDATTQDPTAVSRHPESAFRLPVTPSCLCAMDGATTTGKPCIYPSISSAHVGKSTMKPTKSYTPPTHSHSNTPKTSPTSSPISPPSPPAPEYSSSTTSTYTFESTTQATRKTGTAPFAPPREPSQTCAAWTSASSRICGTVSGTTPRIAGRTRP